MRAPQPISTFGWTHETGNARELYLAESWPCAEEESFITYFVRTLPEKGVDGGSNLLRRAMANREQRGCYQFLLNRVADVVWNSSIEAQAIATLDDSDPEAASNAAQALAQNGGPEVEPFLWKRLERWEEQWRGRTAELEIHPITGGAPNPQANLDSALTGAISSAKSWLFDEPRRKRLVALCAEDVCRVFWGQERAPGTIPVEAFSGGPSYPAGFRVDGYQSRTIEGLKKKLQQFASGTEFRWCPQAWNPFDSFSPGQREEMFKELGAFLSERSMSIEPYLEDKCMPGLGVK